MKKILLFISMIILLMKVTSCDQKKEPMQTSPSDSIIADQKSINAVLFPVDSADAEINSFLREKKLKHWAKKYSLGGEFHNLKDFFDRRNDADTSKGLMLWYNLTDKGRIVLALEPWDLSMQQGKDSVPKQPELIYPDYIFTVSDTTFTIRKHKADSNIIVGGKVKNADVTRRMKAFHRLIRANPSHDQRPFSHRHGGFFQNNPEAALDTKGGLLKRLLSQRAAQGVRYYFGLQDKPDPGLNKLRIILVAIDSAGNNIVVGHPSVGLKTSDVFYDDGVILQKSIPPRP